ncbi:hypothetical protein A6A04_16235 [Paramagnetospirillum marisnigri]|uniref:Uncharacterized protein n=1 Tax=Paramagnetospirillum marisnigri TaxID=1285242 RepID=A0A178MST8_9PROT|nr:hypothetical protein [Paramagnetospirillum marisnigri]OAN51324.1 hypothetical protein A6A04_16235 [Paramagnetospirillum marisnigri]
MTDSYRDGQLRSAWRLVVLVILASSVTYLLREIPARQAMAPPGAVESAEIRLADGDPRYFQAHTGGALPTFHPEEIAGQIKRVAAARGVPAASVRQMVNALIVNNPDIDISTLNQALDSRWPNR